PADTSRTTSGHSSCDPPLPSASIAPLAPTPTAWRTYDRRSAGSPEPVASAFGLRPDDLAAGLRRAVRSLKNSRHDAGRIAGSGLIALRIAASSRSLSPPTTLRTDGMSPFTFLARASRDPHSPN